MDTSMRSSGVLALSDVLIVDNAQQRHRLVRGELSELDIPGLNCGIEAHLASIRNSGRWSRPLDSQDARWLSIFFQRQFEISGAFIC